MHTMLDRESPIPVYFQIQQDLRKRIAHHEWEVNEVMASESELTKYYGVSRVTLRQALAELEKDGLIKRYRGKGAFITADSPKPFVHELNYKLVSGGSVSSSSQSMTAKVIELKYVSPVYEDIKEKLKLTDAQDKAIFFKRVFYLKETPIAIGKSWLPAHLFPRFVEDGMINNSLSETLEKRYKLYPEKEDDFIEVIRSTQKESLLLNCTQDVPLLMVKGNSFLKDGTPVEVSQTAWVGDAVRFKLSLHRSNSGFVIGD